MSGSGAAGVVCGRNGAFGWFWSDDSLRLALSTNCGVVSGFDICGMPLPPRCVAHGRVVVRAIGTACKVECAQATRLLAMLKSAVGLG